MVFEKQSYFVIFKMNKPSVKRIEAGNIDFDYYYFCPGYLYRGNTIKKFPGAFLVSDKGTMKHLIFCDNDVIISDLEGIKNLALPSPTEVLMVYYSTYMLLYVRRTNAIMVFSLIKNGDERADLQHVFDIKTPALIDHLKISKNILEITTGNDISYFEITTGTSFKLSPLVEETECDIYAKLPKKVHHPLPANELLVPPEQAYVYNHTSQQFEGPTIFKHPGVENFTQVENYILACMSTTTTTFDLFRIKYLDTEPWKLSYQPHPEVLKLENQYKYLPSIRGILPTKKMRKWNTLNPDYSFRDPDDIEHFREMLESKF